MKSSLRNVIHMGYALAAVYLLASCAPMGTSPARGGNTPTIQEDSGSAPRGSQGSRATTGGTTSTPQVGGLGAHGTSDSGGGTGIKGKVLESYMVDPMELSAFKKYLAPLFKNIRYQRPGDGSFEIIFKMKPWYIVPVELEEVDKKHLGVSFLKGATEQLARQNLKGVWINKTRFDKMSEKDQADLLMHEFVMALYFMKFLKASELCRANALIDPTVECKNLASFDATLPPTPFRALNKSDNENIRVATNWMLSSLKQPIDNVQIMRFLYANGFDRRFFNPKYYEKNPAPDMTMKGESLYESLRAAQLSGNLPSICVSSKSQKQLPCLITINKSSLQWQGVALPAYAIRFEIQGESPIELFFMGSSDLIMSEDEDVSGNLSYSLLLPSLVYKNKLGDRVHSAYMHLRQDPFSKTSGYTIEAMVLKSGVITSIENMSDKQTTCQARETKPDGKILNEGFSAYRKIEDKDLYLSLSPWRFFPPVVACGSD